MDPLETLLRPLTRVLNRNIGETTPARELAQQLEGKTIAVRVRDTSLAMVFDVDAEVLALKSESDREPDVILTGSLLTLAKMAAPRADAASPATVRDGDLDITGDAYTAQAFQQLLRFARPDIEEELAQIVGDAAAFRAGEIARGVRNWAREARSTMGANIREYLQEESRDLPSRYEVERFARQVDALRDDVARIEARINQLAGGA